MEWLKAFNLTRVTAALVDPGGVGCILPQGIASQQLKGLADMTQRQAVQMHMDYHQFTLVIYICNHCQHDIEWLTVMNIVRMTSPPSAGAP